MPFFKSCQRLGPIAFSLHNCVFDDVNMQTKSMCDLAVV